MKRIGQLLVVLAALACVLGVGLHPTAGVLFERPGAALACALIGLGLCLHLARAEQSHAA